MSPDLSVFVEVYVGVGSDLVFIPVLQSNRVFRVSSVSDSEPLSSQEPVPEAAALLLRHPGIRPV